ncbi:MAG TPA: class I SAM-dependent methyltransferase [Chthonomonadaceae bacterium]|nr:class I SAM-dependent methyltransferase [Chthonomonadaceae bacterium]
MDEVARYNIERWRALADSDALFTRPALDLTVDSARECVDPEGLFGDVTGKEVLCLAGGGGQQSGAFALLGANVTVFDLSEAQLKRDRQVAAHYQKEITTVQGDMRDLSPLASASFDLVFQPYSLGFVPDARVVFAQVARVLRPGGMYYFAISNPFYAGLSEADWNGEGYTLKLPYVDGALITTPDPDWVYARSNKERPAIRECREYRQTFSKLINSLIENGFVLMHVSDSKDLWPEPEAQPGTWSHLISIAPVWLAFWLRYQPAGSGP